MIGLGKREDTQEVKEFQQQFLKYGFHLVRLAKMEFQVAGTGTVKLQMYLETKPVGGDFVGFKEQDGTVHEGLIARADLGVFFDKNDPSKMVRNLTVLAAELGFSNEELQNLKADTIDDFLTMYTKALDGKYFWVMLKAEEYLNKKGKININLSVFEEHLGKDKETGVSTFQIFCRKEDFVDVSMNEYDEDKNLIKITGHDKEGPNIGKQRSKTFDKSSDYYYKPLPVADVEDDDDDVVDNAGNTEDNNSF